MRFKLAVVSALLLGALAPQARAEDPVSLGAFDDWEAFIYHSDGAAVCYVISAPKNSASDKKISKRDPVWFIITNFVGRKIKGQVSTVAGYPYKDQATVALKVNDQDFELYTNGDTAWAADAATEASIVKAMKGAKSLTVTGTSWKGTETTDTYSLTGLSKALDKIDASCK